MPRTSNKAQMIVDYVNQFIQENGYSPSVREIGQAVGLRSTASVSYHLQALQEKGLLQSPGAKGRKRAIVTAVRPGQIPVVGVVTAGLPILAVENQEGTMAWDGEPGCFALRVRGDSMIGAGILSGDRVVVRPVHRRRWADCGRPHRRRGYGQAPAPPERRNLADAGKRQLCPHRRQRGGNHRPCEGSRPGILSIFTTFDLFCTIFFCYFAHKRPQRGAFFLLLL